MTDRVCEALEPGPGEAGARLSRHHARDGTRADGVVQPGSAAYEELESRPCPLGTLQLRRLPVGGSAGPLYEVRIDDQLLISNRPAGEDRGLVDRALATFEHRPIDVVVGGLGLGVTPCAVLDYPNVRNVTVIEPIPELIDWHQRQLVPAGKRLEEDPRCRLVAGDFFDMAAPGGSFDEGHRGRRYEAIIVDMDRSPRHLLYALDSFFYGIEGLLAISDKLTDDGVLALWWTDKPNPEFIQRLEIVFAHVEAEAVLRDESPEREGSVHTIYIARRSSPSA